MAWIKVTGSAGTIVHISADQVVRVRQPASGEATHGSKALIDLSNGQTQSTQESVEEIMKLLSQSRG